MESEGGAAMRHFLLQDMSRVGYSNPNLHVWFHFIFNILS